MGFTTLSHPDQAEVLILGRGDGRKDSGVLNTVKARLKQGRNLDLGGRG